MHRKALEWIVNLLESKQIPFQVCGGLAAIGYGSKRPLNDIDLFVPGERFQEVATAVKERISKPAGHYCEEGWDLEYLQCKYEGCKVEIGNADNTKILNSTHGRWETLRIDFSDTQHKTIFGLEIPLMSQANLIRYKSVLGRPVDLQDIKAMNAYTALSILP
ncbi:hypothetical protein [Motiliproteus sp. MSK22-1]|uniref:hypothetical protein n=1 Tax=Motiliproteus sp. MSK22-1 TaxID=1897630 RepID=UPI000976B359|nr:hypothetical protein [Motiliproteus sp. MSK22-1]OMH39106.1 hypothetical protein BGP75_05235 [Motiliproteus sp. MSK22-1]